MKGGGPDIENRHLPTGVQGSKALRPEEFAHALGMTSWLMTLSKDHKNLPVSVVDERILPAILLKQFRLIFKDKMPIAFLGWALVSDQVARLHLQHGTVPSLAEWRSGPNLIIIECISPFAPADEVKADFFSAQDKENLERS